MRDFNPDARDFQDWAEENSDRFRGVSTAKENFESEIGGVFEEDLTISNRFDYTRDDNSIWGLLTADGFSDRQADKIKSLRDSGMIPEEIFNSFIGGGWLSEYSYDELAEYANEFLDLDDPIPTRKEFDETNKRVLAERRAYRQNVSERSTVVGTVAGFTGGFIAVGLDPVSVVTMPIAAPLAGIKGLSRSMYTFQVARNSALLNAGISAPMEPFIHNWKDKIGSEYTWKDSMINISASALLGGTVSGTAANLGFKYTGKSFLSKDRNSLIKRFRELGATKEEARSMAEYQEAINNAPYKDKPSNEFIEELETKRSESNETTTEILDNTPDTDFKSVTAKTADDELTEAVETKTPAKEDKVEVKSELDQQFDDISDNVILEREDGSTIKAKSLADNAIEENKILKGIKECLTRG